MAVSTLNIKQRLQIRLWICLKCSLDPLTPQSINQSNWSAWHFQTKVDFQCTSNESNTSCCSSTAHCRSSQVKMKSCVLGFDDELAHRNQVVSCSTNLWWMKQESHISRKKKKKGNIETYSHVSWDIMWESNQQLSTVKGHGRKTVQLCSAITRVAYDWTL